MRQTAITNNANNLFPVIIKMWNKSWKESASYI